MKNEILELIDTYWKFDDNQENQSTWHDKQDLLKAVEDVLNKFDVSTQVVPNRKFAIEWMRNVNFGIGSGTEYVYALSREDALKRFWKDKNKEAYEVNNIYIP